MDTGDFFAYDKAISARHLRQQQRLDDMTSFLRETSHILAYYDKNRELPHAYSQYIPLAPMHKQDTDYLSDVVAAFDYTYSRHHSIGAKDVTVTKLFNTSNIPGIAGLQLSEMDMFNYPVHVSAITLVHEAHHDWSKYGLEPIDHNDPRSQSDMAKLIFTKIEPVCTFQEYLISGGEV